MTKKHVIIVGGGFAGMACLRKLAGKPDVQATLIDKNNYHQFKPLLYQVAASALTPDDVATPFRRFFEQYDNIDVKMAEVSHVDPEALTVTTTDNAVHKGDVLVLAAGSTVNFFNTEGAKTYALPLYTLNDAETLRSRVLAAFEKADNDPDLIDSGILNFAIIGAGPTGTEIAGSLADLFNKTLPNEYPDIPVSKASLTLIDHGTAPLKEFTAKGQSYAAHILQQRGVKLKLGVLVKEVQEGKVLLSDGTDLVAETVIWAGGLEATRIAGLETGHAGRLDVLPDLSIKGFPQIFALGDFANIKNGDGYLPQLASVAVQCGEHAAKNILADQQRTPFEYKDKGIMAMIGRNAALAELGKKRHFLKGTLAFLAWLAVHAALLPSFRQRVEAFIEWGWNYFVKANPFQVIDEE